MFMFRRKRNCLAKRLWKARIKRGHEIRSKEEDLLYDDDDSMDDKQDCSGCCPLSDEGLLRNTVLKRLKDNQLEMLVEAVESGGAGVSTCVLVPKDIVKDPHLLCCQIWRWPDIKTTSELRRTPVCPTASDPIYICCNPYHWSRLCDSESSSPPPYSRFNKEKLKPEDRAPSENGMHDYIRPSNRFIHRIPPSYHSRHQREFIGSVSTHGENEQNENEWCKLAYWELSQRVGRLFPVQNTAINIYWADMHGEGLNLETLAQYSFSPPESVHRNRTKIGLGITLSLEDDGVWAHNRSNWPIFVNSPSLNTFLVYRVPAGHCLKIFTPGLQRPPPDYWGYVPTGPVDPNSVRISFAKGWGPKYSRQEITSCPTWIEVLLSPCR